MFVSTGAVLLGAEIICTTNTYALKFCYMAAISPSNEAITLFVSNLVCEVNGFIRQQIATQGLWNALCLDVSAIFHCLTSPKVLHYEGNRLNRANNEVCFYFQMDSAQ